MEGQVSVRECALLISLAKRASKGVILEVGSFRGRSTVALALGTRMGANLPVFAIEPHEPFRGPLGGEFGPVDRVHFFRNLLAAGVAEQVRLVNLSSEHVSATWERPIGLLWIDGDHSYEGTRRDVDCWTSLVPVGGTVAFHDAIDPTLGPIRVIEELMQTGHYEMAGQIDVTTVLHKIA